MAPWSKDAGPLGKAQKEGDVLKKKVDQIVKECNKLVAKKKEKDKDMKLQQMYQNCIDTKGLVEIHKEKVNLLKEEDETGKVKDFEKKKTQEQNRITVMTTTLTETMSKLLPDTTEEQFIKEHSPEEKELDDTEKDNDDVDEDDEEEEEEEEEDEDEEEEEDEEDDEEDDEEETNGKHPAKPVAATRKKIADVESEEEEEEEYVEDEEEEEESEEEERPVAVKRSVLKANEKNVKKQEDSEEEDEEDDEEDDDEDDEDDEDDKGEKDRNESAKKSSDKKKPASSASVTKFIAIDDFEKQQDGDLAFSCGEILTLVAEREEDDWWIAENKSGERGLVPPTFLQEYKPEAEEDEEDDEESEKEEYEEEEDTDLKKKGRKLWGDLRDQVVSSEQGTSVSDVLHAMGAVPSGFRMSTLCRKFNEGETHRLANYLTPKLSQSNLIYSDLFFDPATNKIRPRSTRIDRLVTVVSCQQIPNPGAGLEISSRHVKICLFDGKNILSNIHTVTVSTVDKTLRNWSFSTKVSDACDPFTCAETFLRTNNTTDNIGILFELCASYTRVSTRERGEFSCGWVHLPLLEGNGVVITNRTFDFQLNGGTPYEKGVEVDPSISRRTTGNSLVSLISGNKQPRLQVKVSVPKGETKELLDTLPDTMMGTTCLLQHYSLFRRCQVDMLLRDRLDIDLESTELVHSPLMQEFPCVADTPDLMRLFRMAWSEKLKSVKRSEKRDEEFVKDKFRQVFMESVYPVYHLATLPAFRMGDPDSDKIRHEVISKFTEVKRQGGGSLAALLSPDLTYQPFFTTEVSYNIISSHCTSRTVAVES